MPPRAVDATAEFHELVKKHGAPTRKPRPLDEGEKKRRAASAAWNREARRVKQHVATLYVFLTGVRRAYLDMTGKARTAESNDDANSPFAKWRTAAVLTDADRDEIDMHVKLAINAGLDLVQTLEKGEKLRKAAADRALSKAFSAVLPGILHGSALARQRNASDQLAVYHAGVTNYLSTQLATLSGMQAALQERRVELQRQRYEKLSDGAAREKNSNLPKSAPVHGAVGAIGGDISTQLTDTQLQAFEEETSQMVKALQADLAAIQHAEQQLHGIAELQTRIHTVG
ncbi:hypothetical protein MCUN1_000468 [Malassezia cuniculi]|uniref:SNARE-complex protein Syntaxin-18 N-terminal domain-containing protein n=1 Tax=Malassezia cuniculi TaxID=948313 RepID=A0AAF0EP20_9BASI|nr:hypothetical protein MCUN1_000468 [Malassezia cuniculi]